MELSGPQLEPIVQLSLPFLPKKRGSTGLVNGASMPPPPDVSVKRRLDNARVTCQDTEPRLAGRFAADYVKTIVQRNSPRRNYGRLAGKTRRHTELSAKICGSHDHGIWSLSWDKAGLLR